METKVEEDDSDMMVKIQPDVKIKVEKSEVPIHDNENEVPSYENDVPNYENEVPIYENSGYNIFKGIFKT